MTDWTEARVADLIERHFCGPSPDCEERPVFHDDEWGVLKTTAVTWSGWNQEAHKVLPREYWGQASIEVQAGDVLVTKAGPRQRVGVVAHIPSTRPRLIVSGKMIALRPRRDLVMPEVLGGLLALRAPQKYIHDRTTGMAESQVNYANGVLLNTPLLVPPIGEQNAMVRIANTLDTTIRQTEAIIEKLKQVKQGLLHDLLTRGIDANGELRPPQSEAPHLYKASPLGWIPDSWEVRRIGDIGETVTGSTPPSSDPYAWGFHRPFVTPVEVVEGPGISCAERNISERGAGYVRMLPAGSTLVVCIGSTIGKVGFALVELCTNQQINAVIPGEMVVPEYLPLATQKGIAQLRAMAGLQAVPIVNKSAFDSMLIPVPPRWEQEIICERLSALAARSHREEQLVAKLQQTKSGLMDDLLTGRVRVTSLLAQPTGT